MRGKLLGLFGLGAACAACCLPLVPVWLAAIGVGGLLSAKIGGMSLDYIICTFGPWFTLACAGSMIWLALRKRRQPACGCETSCKV